VSLTILGWHSPGWVSGDGLAIAGRLESGTLALNPNHLLLEPVVSDWARLSAAWSDRALIDRLPILSVISGSLAVGLFRLLVVPLASGSRIESNVRTAWLGGAAAYLDLWISAEAHMIQMPVLVAALAATLRVPVRGWKAAALAGALLGLAILVFVSNALVGAGMVIGAVLAPAPKASALLQRVAHVVIAGAAAMMVAGAGLYMGWSAEPGRSSSSIEWVVAYGGSGAPGGADTGYGVDGAGDLATSAARTLYGFARVLVETDPLVEAVREGTRPRLRHAASVVVLGLAGLLLLRGIRDAVRHPGRRATAPVIGAAVGIVGGTAAFALFWNNADTQFYFQAAPAVALLVSTLPWSRLGVVPYAPVLLVPLWNLTTVVVEKYSYPRARLIHELQAALEGTGLVIAPGSDQITPLVVLGGIAAGNRLLLTSLADRNPAPAGLRALADSVNGRLDRNECVGFVGVFRVSPTVLPWKGLSKAGYPPEAVSKALAGVAAVRRVEDTSRFTVEVWCPEPGQGRESKRQ
jgi:hypothetical protein